MTVRYPTLEDYLHAAAYVLDLPVGTIIKAARIELTESALHTPQAGWSEVEFFPTFPMKAAVLLVRLAKNHALPDGNKRAALATTIAFCDVNGYDWTPPAGDDPDGEETFQRMRAIAAAPPRTWRRSRPRSPPGSPSGCARVPGWLTDRSDEAIMGQGGRGSRAWG